MHAWPCRIHAVARSMICINKITVYICGTPGPKPENEKINYREVSLTQGLVYICVYVNGTTDIDSVLSLYI